MTYCLKCGTKNLDDATVCSKCGASLGIETDPDPHREEECFGLPDGNLIASMIFGFIIIVVGISWLLGLNFWRLLWPFLFIILGLLIILGSIYRFKRR